MKRELKFRAQRKLNGEWVYGSFVKGSSEDWDYIVDMIDEFENADRIRVISNTVGQLTGIKDKNGVDIYEGDEVRILYTDWPSNFDPNISLDDYKKSISNHGTVIWDFQHACWSILIYSDKYAEFIHSSIMPGPHGEIEVTGNKHQK